MKCFHSVLALMSAFCLGFGVAVVHLTFTLHGDSPPFWGWAVLAGFLICVVINVTIREWVYDRDGSPLRTDWYLDDDCVYQRIADWERDGFRYIALWSAKGGKHRGIVTTRWNPDEFPPRYFKVVSHRRDRYYKEVPGAYFEKEAGRLAVAHE